MAEETDRETRPSAAYARIYPEDLRDDRIDLLAERLSISRLEARGLLLGLVLWGAENAADGNLAGLDPVRFAKALAYGGRPTTLLSALAGTGGYLSLRCDGKVRTPTLAEASKWYGPALAETRRKASSRSARALDAILARPGDTAPEAADPRRGGSLPPTLEPIGAEEEEARRVETPAASARCDRDGTETGLRRDRDGTETPPPRTPLDSSGFESQGQDQKQGKIRRFPTMGGRVLGEGGIDEILRRFDAIYRRPEVGGGPYRWKPSRREEYRAKAGELLALCGGSLDEATALLEGFLEARRSDRWLRDHAQTFALGTVLAHANRVREALSAKRPKAKAPGPKALPRPILGIRGDGRTMLLLPFQGQAEDYDVTDWRASAVAALLGERGYHDPTGLAGELLAGLREVIEADANRAAAR